MTKKSIIYFFLTILMVIYLAFSVSYANKMADEALCTGVLYSLQSKSSFVEASDIDHELDGLRDRALSMKMGEISPAEIEQRLSELSIIESARCYRLNNEKIMIEVVPMIPRARVFESGETYYINHDGKKLTANARYQIDVPVVYGYFDEKHTPVSMIPLIEKIAADSARSQLVSVLKMDRNGDIIIIPSIIGHVVNFGDTANIDDKFDRLMAFYRNVMPYKGWNYYDTISVKFRGQVVGKISGNHTPKPFFEYANADYIEEVDAESASDLSAEDDILMLKPKIGDP